MKRKFILSFSFILLSACSEQSKFEQAYQQATAQRDHQAQYDTAKALLEMGESQWQAQLNQHQTSIELIREAQNQLKLGGYSQAFLSAAQAKKLDNALAADTILRPLVANQSIKKLVLNTQLLLDESTLLYARLQDEFLSRPAQNWDIIALNRILAELSEFQKEIDKGLNDANFAQDQQLSNLYAFNQHHVAKLTYIKQQLIATAHVQACVALCAQLNENLTASFKNLESFDERVVVDMMDYRFKQQLQLAAPWLELSNNIRISLEQRNDDYAEQVSKTYASFKRLAQGPKYSSEYWQLAKQDMRLLESQEVQNHDEQSQFSLSDDSKTFKQSYLSLAYLGN